jgi:hypothetical protein
LGGTSTLSFSFSNGTGAINGGIGAVMSGGTKVVNPGGTTTYTLTVTNALGATFTATATVTVVPAPTIASYTATPATIMVGGSSTLAYSFANGTGVINQGVGAVISGGTKVVSPGTTTAYTLTVTNAAGAAVAATAMVSVTGVFVPTGSLSVPRSRHCAALLPNGKVLIVGGEQHTSQPYPQATAEVYDPVTGAFSPTGSMVGLWFAHSATLLPSGEVLVIGIGAGGANSELYNPISGTFRATTGSPRGYMAPVLLPNGKVLTTGGGATWSVRVAIRGYYVADLYNPNSQTFSPTGTMSYARGGHTATLLSTGKVLVAGGFGDFFDYPDDAIAFAELYDPITGSFGYTHDMNSGRVGHTATLLPNGKVLIVGGLIRWDLGAGVLETAEIYDPTTKTFSPTGNMHWKRVGHTATLLPNGKVLVTGGCYGGEAEQYDPSLGLFFPTGNMGACRVSHTSTLLPNGKVLIVGGSSANGANDALASALLYQ